jgi:hypothetical protein
MKGDSDIHGDMGGKEHSLLAWKMGLPVSRVDEQV